MKLVKINDVRKGQIYKGIKNYYLISSDIMVFDNVNGCCYHCSEFGLDNEYTGIVLHIHKNDIKQFELIGFLDITHKVVGNKLIEIPREELEKDDIILCTNFCRNEYGNIVGQFTKKICYNGCIDELKKLKEENNKIEKIGTLGINYKFINDKLLEENE